jgi:hypothetical protein
VDGQFGFDLEAEDNAGNDRTKRRENTRYPEKMS